MIAPGPATEHNTGHIAVPTDIRLRKKSGLLELRYNDGTRHELPAELLRVFSPSAEVKGHGKGQEVLQTGKRLVQMTAIEPIGQYAIRLSFDDGHDSGIYSWDYLYHLGEQQQTLWQQYLDRLQQAQASRDALPAGTQAIKIVDPTRNSGPAGGQ
ncbi:MAG: DUF971 domain-containing protein [Pseudohongiella sp.]|uniref:gamma-butyrobetaine hydroxylase-like domain-containing protein n=1 Tax=Pseudohongiella sp. TaxID=1979412 RepID=UPI0034A05654